MDQKAAILNDPGMRSIYINPDTNDTWKEGDTYTRLNFANTLERIAKLGSEASPCPIILILSQILSNVLSSYTIEGLRAVHKQGRLKICNFDLLPTLVKLWYSRCFSPFSWFYLDFSPRINYPKFVQISSQFDEDQIDLK